jgi:hypothetical protein
MNDTSDAIWTQLATELGAISAQDKEMAFGELRDKLAKVESDFTSRLLESDRGEDVIHVRRAVARRIFSLAIDKGLSASECESYLNDIMKLRIEEFDDECTFVLMLCRHLIRLQDREKANCYLDMLQNRHALLGSPFNWISNVIAELRN